MDDDIEAFKREQTRDRGRYLMWGMILGFMCGLAFAGW